MDNKQKFKDSIKKKLNRRPVLLRLFSYIYWYVKLYFKTIVRLLLGRYKVIFHKSKKPITLQLPITNQCNMDCIMCNITSKSKEKNFSFLELDKILNNKLFSKIRSVGVNGGEPFLKKDLIECVEVILNRLVVLKSICIISNGYFTDRILSELQKIKALCDNKGVKLVMSISIDGFGEIHDDIRQKKGAFEQASQTCIQIMKDKSRYCHSFCVLCTITKRNIYYINEVDAWVKKQGIPISYNLATVHERLYNYCKYDKFSIFTDTHAQMMAEEFFYGKFRESYNELYYSLYHYIRDRKRLSICSYQYNACTLTPDGCISFCATHSKLLGNALKENAYDIYFKNKKYRNHIKQEYCGTCSHYSGCLTFKTTMKYNREILRIVGNPWKYVF